MVNLRNQAKTTAVRRVSSSRPGWKGASFLLPFLTLIGTFFFTPSHLYGQDLRAFSFAAENDGLAFWTPPHQRTDWYYTHGTKIDVVFAASLPGSSLLGGDTAPPCLDADQTGPCSLTRIRLGQSIFTPEALFIEPPPASDRPYAGWLYLDMSAIRLEERRIRRLGLDVGVTGGPSLAGPLHKWFHRSLGKHEPVGWDSQIPFELAFSFTFENHQASTLGEDSDGFTLRLVHRGIVQAGTLRTGALGGLSFQAGWHAPPFLEWAGVRPRHTYFQVTLGADAEVVVRDLFLDGSTFGGGPHVERIPLVGHLRASIQMGSRAFGLEVSGTRMTSQFTGQAGPHTVGTVRFIIRP